MRFLAVLVIASVALTPQFLSGHDARADTVSFVSGTDWEVFDADPDGPGPANSLGNAQNVCLNASSPSNCPSEATLYGYPGAAWTADLSTIPGATWIWAPGITGATSPADLQEFFFRKQFDLAGTPTAATLSIAVDNFAEVRVNGVSAGTHGSITDCSEAGFASVKVFDISSLLVPGTNTLTIRAQNGPPECAGCAPACSYGSNPAGVVFGGSIQVGTSPSPAQLAETVVGADYTWGAKGWDMTNRVFVEPPQITTGDYWYWRTYYDAEGKLKGSKTLGKGLDCSGLIFWSYNKAYGATNPSSVGTPVRFEGADGQYLHNFKLDVAPGNLEPGDVLFFDWDSDGDKDHVAMYVGPSEGGDVIHASSSEVGVVWDTAAHLSSLQGFVGYRRWTEPEVGIEFKSHSPVDLVITDPDGFSVSRDAVIAGLEENAIEVPGQLYYSQWDTGGDGSVDDAVIGPVRKMGQYHVGVVAEDGAAPTDTYTLTVEAAGQSITLAQDVPVSGIPSGGYTIESTESGISETSVGGIAELPNVADSPAPAYLTLVGLAAVALLALTAGGWFARRRWLR